MKKNIIKINLFDQLTILTVKKKRITILIIFFITLISFIGFLNLKFDFTYFSMLPENNQKSRELKKIISKYSAFSTIIIVVQSKSYNNLIATIENINKELKKNKYKKFINSIYYKIDSNFIKKYGLLLEDLSFLEKFESSNNIIYSEFSKILKKKFTIKEKKIIRDTLNNFYYFLKSFNLEYDNYYNKSNQIIITKLNNSNELKTKFNKIFNNLIFGNTYLVNDKLDTGIIFVQTKFNVFNVEKNYIGVNTIENAVKKYQILPSVKIGITGFGVIARDEIDTTEQGLIFSSLIAISLILILLIINFRMIEIPLLTGIPLIIGIIWTIGISGLILKRLTIITAMYMIALLGLGIDYAIHLLTAFTFERMEGINFIEAIKKSLNKSGRGIITGAITTSAAFFSLIVARYKIIDELGIVAGIGIISELISMFLFIPFLLSIRNSLIERKGKKDSILRSSSKFEIRITKDLGKSIQKSPYIYFIITIIIVIITSFYVSKVKIESNLMKMEARGLESIELQDILVRKFNFAPDCAYLDANSIEQTEKIIKKLKKLKTVGLIESILNFIPPHEIQKKKMEILENFKLKLKFLVKAPSLILLEMSMNNYGLPELQKDLKLISKKVDFYNYENLEKELNKVFSNYNKLNTFIQFFINNFYIYFKNFIPDDFITIDKLPSEIISRYLSNDKKENLILIYPSKNPWIKKNREILMKDLSKISDKITGNFILGDIFNEIAEIDGIKTSITALIVIFFIILIDFKNLFLAISTMVPLILSLISLLGIMGFFKIKFDFVNIISIPLLIGIGIDDAVHFSHRYLIEGKGKMEIVIEKIGKAVLLTSLTTIIGFSSFIPSPMRAMKSTGIVLSLAMALALFYSVFFYPAFLIIIREKLKLKLFKFLNKKL